MAALTEARLKADKRLKNLRPWKKGEAPKVKSPGRPPIVDFASAFRDHVNKGKRPETLFNDLLKKKPEVSMFYLAGKPLDRTVTVNVETTIDQLAKAVVRLEKQGNTNTADTQSKSLISNPSDISNPNK